MMSMRNNGGYGQGGYQQALAAAAQCLAPGNQGQFPQQRGMVNTGACGVPQPRAGQEVLTNPFALAQQQPPFYGPLPGAYPGGPMQQTQWGADGMPLYNPFACFDYGQQDCVYDPYCGPFQTRRGPRRTVLCLGGGAQNTVPAGQTLRIPITVDQPFMGTRLMIPSDIAGALMINDIRVRNRSQIICGPLPARLFTEVSQCCNKIDFDVAGSRDEITIDVTNTSRCPVIFTGGIEGVAIFC